MSARFLSFDELVSAAEERMFERPTAIVNNAHVTGLGVARALDRHDVPVIALDRTPDGVAPGSTAVNLAGRVTYPLDDREEWLTIAQGNVTGGDLVTGVYRPDDPDPAYQLVLTELLDGEYYCAC